MTSPTRTRLATAGVAVAALATLAGCAGTTGTTGTGTGTGSAVGDSPAGGQTFTDGTYTATASYQAPSGTESITVELAISGSTVTAVTVDQQATDHEARNYQARFASGISDAVVGKSLAELSVSRVAGSSLTSNGFNQALDAIRSQAA